MYINYIQVTAGVETAYANLPAANELTQHAMDEYQLHDHRCRAQFPITHHDSNVRQRGSIIGLFTALRGAMHGVVDDLDTMGPPQPFGRGSTHGTIQRRNHTKQPKHEHRIQ